MSTEDEDSLHGFLVRKGVRRNQMLQFPLVDSTEPHQVAKVLELPIGLEVKEDYSDTICQQEMYLIVENTLGKLRCVFSRRYENTEKS